MARRQHIFFDETIYFATWSTLRLILFSEAPSLQHMKYNLKFPGIGNSSHIQRSKTKR